jgi:hypothetical protein
MSRSRRRILWWIGGVFAGLALLAAGILFHLNYVPTDLDGIRVASICPLFLEG